MRLVWIIAPVLVACQGLSATGSGGLVGVLVDSEGSPVSDQRIQAEIAFKITDEKGEFAIPWSPPATEVTIRRGGVLYRRKWLPETDKGRVRLGLPVVDQGQLVCRTELPCMADIVWDVAPGFEAELEVPCGPETPVTLLPGMPVELPRASCSTIKGDVDLVVERVQGRVTLTGRRSPHPVEVVGAPSDLECSVAVLDGSPSTGGLGVLGVLPSRDTWAWALCGGRAGVPVPVPLDRKPIEVVSDADGAPRQPDRLGPIQLPWSQTGVDLVLPTPGTDDVLRISRSPEGGGHPWEMDVSPDGQTYHLPPLPRGLYRMGVGAPSALAKVNPPDPEVPGVVNLAIVEGEWGIEGGYVGALRLEEDLNEGSLSVSGLPKATP